MIDQLGRDYLVEYARVLSEDETRVRELWQGDLGVEVIDFPQGELLGVLEDAGVKEVRQEWIDKANAAGVPADEIAKSLAFDAPS